MPECPSAERITCSIGPLVLDPGAGVLSRDGVALPLGQRAVAILHRLVEAPGEIVGKAALYDAAWRGQTVEESNLTVQISQLRRALRAEVAAGAGWIETLARRGYRFTGPARWQTAAPPRHPALISNIPIAVPLHFTGRADALAAIDAVLAEPVAHRPASQRPATVALHGMRGVGKTILAATYARRHAADYRATWWLRAETTPTLRADLAALAIRLGWAPPDASEGSAVDAALEGVQRSGEGVLLIFDNASDAAGLRPYLPNAGGARIIVTTNARAWRALATPIELAVWPSTVGADYLIARTGRTGERADAETLSAALEGLPLAHEQAAAYIESLELSFSEYVRRLDAKSARLLDDAAHAPADYHDGLTVAKAFRLAIAQAAAQHAAAEPLLCHAAVLAAEPIPIDLFVEAREALGEPLATLLADDGLEKAVAALRGFALISREVAPDERDPALRTDCLRLHRLVRQVAAARLDDAAATRCRAALIRALSAVYPGGVFNTPASWPRARRLDALALPLVAPPSAIPEGAEAAASVLLDRLASFQHGALAAFARAIPLGERACALADVAFGPDHPFTAQALNNLALLFRDHGDLDAARPLYARSLAIRVRALGPAHPDVASSLLNLGNLHADQGDLAAARPYSERGLAIREAYYGPAHPQTAQAMNNLARQLHRLGDTAAARRLHERALAVRASSLGEQHPDTANSLKNLALLHLDLGNLDTARDMGARALAIAEAALGADHPETASIRANLARFILADGDAASALPVAERALAALSARLRPGAPFLRAAAAVTAECLDALGCATQAATLRKRHAGPAQPSD